MLGVGLVGFSLTHETGGTMKRSETGIFRGFMGGIQG